MRIADSQGDVQTPSSSVPTMLDGFEIRVDVNGDKWTVQPGDVSVLAVKEVSWGCVNAQRWLIWHWLIWQASNGRILYLDQVLSYPMA
jgi:hypothetical protein